MSRNHDHHHAGHEGHSHAPEVNALNARRVGLAALLTGAFMAVEVIGGLVSGSLALLADAGHMLTDFGALALAWFAFRLARRPADWRRTYGFDRFSVLVAFVNGLALFVIASVIVWEAIERLQDPSPVLGGMMLAVAAAGLLVNIVAFKLLSGADSANLNVRGALLHVAGDMLGSIAAIVAAGVIMLTGWTAADPLLSMLVAVIILRSAWGVTRDAAHILLQGVPEGLDVDQVADDLMANISGLVAVHHIHVWALTEARPIMTLHAQIANDATAGVVKAAVKARLLTHFHVDHTTVEIERADDPQDVTACALPGQ